MNFLGIGHDWDMFCWKSWSVAVQIETQILYPTGQIDRYYLSDYEFMKWNAEICLAQAPNQQILIGSYLQFVLYDQKHKDYHEISYVVKAQLRPQPPSRFWQPFLSPGRIQETVVMKLRKQKK